MTLDPTVATRVSPELRAALERIARRQRVHLGDVLRRAALEYVNRLEESLDGRPATHRGDPQTSKQASLERWPRAKTQRRRGLEAFAAAGDTGLTGDELARACGWPDYMTGRRVASELKLGGWVRPKRGRHRDELTGEETMFARTRASIHGNPQEVLILAAKAEPRLPELKFPGQTTIEEELAA